MVKYCGWWEPTLVVLVFAVLAGVTLRHVARGESVALGLVLTASLGAHFFIVFKTTFTRCHPSRLVVLAALMGFAGLASLVAARRLSRPPKSVIGSAIALAACLALNIVAPFSERSAAMVGRHMKRITSSPEQRVKGMLTQILRPEKQQQKHREKIDDIRARFPLPRIEGSVDWFGNRQAIALAHDLDYRPRPVFQRFTAYTPYLAKLNGRFYAGPAAPDNVVFDFGGVSHYPVTLLDSHAFREIVSSYEVAETTQDFLVLRRTTRRKLRPRLLQKATVPIGKMLAVDKAAGDAPLWVRIDVPDTLTGKLSRLFFKMPGIWLDLEFEAGPRKRFRFAASPARSGFWLSPMIREKQDLQAYLAGGVDATRPETRVRALRLFQKPWSGSTFREVAHVQIFTLVED